MVTKPKTPISKRPVSKRTAAVQPLKAFLDAYPKAPVRDAPLVAPSVKETKGFTMGPDKETHKAPLRSPTRVLFTSYPTYNFSDQDPAIDHLHTIIDDAGTDIKDLAANSRVSRSTMRNWFSGKTISPRFCTISAVAGALGYDYKLTKRKS